jgi:inorganic pyrophosphatase
MNPLKQYKKLQALNVKAEQCLSREEAQEVIRKADKAYCKLAFASYYGSLYKK